MLQTLVDEADVPHGVRRHVVRDTGHFAHVEDPDEVARLLQDWFADPTP